jgi:hypothetical protein
LTHVLVQQEAETERERVAAIWLTDGLDTWPPGFRACTRGR